MQRPLQIYQQREFGSAARRFCKQCAVARCCCGCRKSGRLSFVPAWTCDWQTQNRLNGGIRVLRDEARCVAAARSRDRQIRDPCWEVAIKELKTFERKHRASSQYKPLRVKNFDAKEEKCQEGKALQPGEPVRMFRFPETTDECKEVRKQSKKAEWPVSGVQPSHGDRKRRRYLRHQGIASNPVGSWLPGAVRGVEPVAAVQEAEQRRLQPAVGKRDWSVCTTSLTSCTRRSRRTCTSTSCGCSARTVERSACRWERSTARSNFCRPSTEMEDVQARQDHREAQLRVLRCCV